MNTIKLNLLTLTMLLLVSKDSNLIFKKLTKILHREGMDYDKLKLVSKKSGKTIRC